MVLNNSINFTYKKSNKNIQKKNNISGKNSLKDKEVLERVDINRKGNHTERSQGKPPGQFISATNKPC